MTQAPPPPSAPQPVPPSPQPVPPGAPVPPVGDLPQDAKTMGMLCHLLGAFTWFVGPLVIWLMKKHENPFIDDQGKEALNWQITVTIGWFAVGILSVIPIIGCITILLMPALAIGNLVLCIMACMKANQGIAYRYPFALRLVK